MPVSTRKAATTKKRKLDRRAAGTCFLCDEPPEVGYTMCAHHRATNNNKKNRDRRKRDRLAAFERYGRSCACCGEANAGFLTIDHIDGGGTKHRAEMSCQIYAWLRKHGYPPGFQTLCYNCNCGRGANGGICPHHSGR